METRTQPDRKPKRKLKKSKVGMIIVIVLVAVSCVLAGKVYAMHKQELDDEALRQEIISTAALPEGVTIGGLDVSGMSADEAMAALVPAEDALTKDVGFTLVYEDKTYTLSRDDFDISYNTRELVEEAMLLAREGDLVSLQAELEDIKNNGRSYDIEYTLQPRELDQLMTKLSGDLFIAPVDATYAVKPLEINADTKAQYAVDVGLPADAPEGSDLRDMRFDFTESVDGRAVDIDELTAAIAARTESREWGEIQIPVELSPAAVTVASIKENLIMRSSAATFYGKRPYNRDTRVFNMTKACGLVYGTTLQPGDVFSANTILGNRTYELGWKPAPAVIDGGANSEDQAGGGVCQISTTVYNAVLKADLNIVYRQGHSSKLSYVDGGFDATIDSGRIDFKWSNNTEAPIYVFIWVDTDTKYIRCEIYGCPFPDTFDEIKLESEYIDTIAPTADEYIVNGSLVAPYWILKNASKKGYGYQTYAIYMKNGEVVEKREIAKTVYKMHPARYYVWPGYVEGTALLPENRLYPEE